RETYELYRRDDLVTDFLSYLRGQLDKLPVSERVWPHLAACYIHWWGDDREQSLAELTLASEAVPGDATLRFEVATAHEKNNAPDEPLGVADSIPPLDQSTMKKKKNPPLRLGVRTVNTEPARWAADRLFGPRLAAETKTRLAGQMQQLGMHDHAEAVRPRAR